MNKSEPTVQIATLSVGAVVSHAARLLTQALAEAQRTLHLAPAQYRVLVELWQDEPLTQHDLVRRLDIEQSTVGATMSRMARDGLIQLQPHPHDGRSQVICLTELARQLKIPATNLAKEINDDVLSEFSEEERVQLFELLGKIINKLKKNI